jgi:hypothetical protein
MKSGSLVKLPVPLAGSGVVQQKFAGLPAQFPPLL